MHRGRGLLALFTTLVVAALVAAPAASAKPDLIPGQPVQLALGDSWAWGVGASDFSTTGYVPQLNEALREQFGCLPARSENAAQKCKKLQLVNLAVPGATTPTLTANQLPAALELLAARNQDANPRNDVEVITLHIGGNDVTFPILAACARGASLACLQTIQSELAAYRADLDQLLSQLREAAGPDTRIVIGSYDNAFDVCALGSIPGAVLLANTVLEGGFGVAGLHDIMREVGATYDVEFVDVFNQLAPDDWVGGGDCLHPDDSGYDKVTEAFVDVLVGS